MQPILIRVVMWTGDMQSEYPTQWALNPSAYQNLSNDQGELF